MTITAVLFADTYPVIIADTLLSAPSEYVNGALSLPTIAGPVSTNFEIHTPIGPMKFSELSQKIYAFGKNGMFTYSGSRRVARVIAQGIARRLEAGEEMSEAIIEQELRGLSHKDRTDISFAVVYDTNDDKPMLYRHGMSTFKSKVFGDIYFAGKGDKNLVKLLTELDGPRSHGVTVPAKTDDGIEVFAYFCSALSLTSKLTSLDLAPERKSLKDAHGAVYDIRILSDAGVEAPKILYTFWEMRLEANDGLTLQLKCLMLTWRDGQHYRIERAVTYGKGASQISVGGSASYCIAPLFSAEGNVSSDVFANRPWPTGHLPYAVHYVEYFGRDGGRIMKLQWPETMAVGKTSEFITLAFNEANVPVTAQMNGEKLVHRIVSALKEGKATS